MVEPEQFPGSRKYPGPAVDPTEGPGLALCNVRLSFSKTAGTMTVPIFDDNVLYGGTIIFTRI
jgi:hypothetical protein